MRRLLYGIKKRTEQHNVATNRLAGSWLLCCVVCWFLIFCKENVTFVGGNEN